MMERMLILITLALLLISSYSQSTSLNSIMTNDIDINQDNIIKEAYLLMNILADEYTSKCIRVIILPKHSDNLLKSLSSSLINSNTIIFSQQQNITFPKLTSYSCVTFMLLEAPDSVLISLIKDCTNRIKVSSITRYLMVYIKNNNDVQDLLLNQQLYQEENVAAITHHYQLNKINYNNNGVNELNNNKGTSYWRVLIRQLLHPSRNPQILVVNKWSINTGLHNNINIFPKQMNNFYGTRLRAVSLVYEPFIIFEEVAGSQFVKPMPCVDLLLLNVLAKKLNFTYEIVQPEDRQWGVLKPDGTFTGVVGDVQKGKANFSFTLNLMVQRARKVDCSRMFFADPLSFMTPKSSPGAPWRKIITPFKLNVWICVVVFLAFGSVLYYIITYTQSTLTSTNNLSIQTVMHILASFLSQSIRHIPTISAGKVFLGFWFLYAWLLTTYYKTSLTSTLSVPFAPPTLNTLNQLMQSDLNYGSNKIKGAQYQLFSTTTIPIYQEMFRNMQFHTFPDSFPLIDEGNYALVAYKGFLRFNMKMHNSNRRRKRDFHVATEEFFLGGYVWVFPKGSAHGKTFDAIMWRCVQVGLINKWYDDITNYYIKQSQQQNTKQTQDQDVQQKDDSKQVVFSLSHLQGPFYTLFLGYLLGLILFFLELYASTVKA